MSAEDAEEYTRSLGQVMAGGWRQIALAQKLGVPEALGMTPSAWARERIGGHVRLGLDERREAARELTNPEGEFQYSQRGAAEVLGVDQKTVSNDLRREENSSAESDLLEAATEVDEENSSAEEAAEPTDELSLADFVMPEMELESEEERAYYALTRQRLVVRFDAATVADAAMRPDAALPGFEELEAWFSSFMARLRANAASPVRAVQ